MPFTAWNKKKETDTETEKLIYYDFRTFRDSNYFKGLTIQNLENINNIRQIYITENDVFGLNKGGLTSKTFFTLAPKKVPNTILQACSFLVDRAQYMDLAHFWEIGAKTVKKL